MPHLAFIARHPRRALSALATLLVASGLVVGSGAFFQSADANLGNSVGAGTIDLQAFGVSGGGAFDARDCDPRESTDSGTPTGAAGTAASNSPDPQFDGCANSQSHSSTGQIAVRNGSVFQISDMEPGQTVRGRMKLENAGSLDAIQYLRLSDRVGSAALFNALYVRVYRRPSSDDPTGEPNNEVYRGPLSQLDDAWVKATEDGDPIGSGESELYDFFVKLPETGTDQSSLMGTSTTFRLNWLGRDQGAPTP
jgi:hypothetical protein